MQCVLGCQMMEIIYISLSEVALEIIQLLRFALLSVLAVSQDESCENFRADTAHEIYPMLI